jgi:3-hydroxybutyrate dehydrogenase
VKPAHPRVLVTGGGAGIGLAIARAFRDAGHEVVIAGRTESRLRAASLPYVIMDVCDPASIAAALERAGQIDIFVANAGDAASAPIFDTTRADWDRMIALNLTGVFSCAQAALPAMVERGWGRFIALGSVASLRGFSYVAAYAAAKHGALGLVRSMALELAHTGITVNAICPGFTDTSGVSGAGAAPPDDVLAALVKMNPMGRLVMPHEVAAAALWLASDAADSVNGQAIAIDGGATA